jgi:hypothetical protein
VIVGVQHRGACPGDEAGPAGPVPLEFGDVHPEEAAPPHLGPDLGRDRSEVLANDRRADSAGLGEDDRVELLYGVPNVGAPPSRLARRYPEQPMDAQYMIDPEDPGHRELVLKGSNERCVSHPSERLGNIRSHTPILTGRYPGIGGRSDLDLRREDRPIPARVESVGVGSDGQIEREDNPAPT